jgi:hypothetical protein
MAVYIFDWRLEEPHWYVQFNLCEPALALVPLKKFPKVFWAASKHSKYIVLEQNQSPSVQNLTFPRTNNIAPTRPHSRMYQCRWQFMTPGPGWNGTQVGNITLFLVRPLCGHSKPPPICEIWTQRSGLLYCKHGIFVIFRNNLNGFWDFCHVTTVGHGSPKVCILGDGMG